MKEEFTMYGESLKMFGYLLIILTLAGGVIYILRWRTRRRRLHKRLRETYGEKCCVRLREAGLHAESGANATERTGMA